MGVVLLRPVAEGGGHGAAVIAVVVDRILEVRVDEAGIGQVLRQRPLDGSRAGLREAIMKNAVGHRGAEGAG